MAGKRYRQPKKIKMHSITKRLIVAGLLLICIFLVLFSLYMVLRGIGKSNLYRHAGKVANEQLTQNLSHLSDAESMDENSVEATNTEGVETKELEEGQIYYNGEILQYNEDILTFLCLGVDAGAGVLKEKVPGKGGQADAVMLIVVNPHKETLQVINVNRDSMVEIELYDTQGDFAGAKTMQIALQYAYGDGKELSCELMEKVVSQLFYGIPIHGYVAFDMEAIPILNDSVGGVSVTVREDMTKYKKGWTEGAAIDLTGEDALLYVREREDESGELGSNVKRIERQKQYLLAFARKLKEKAKSDITIPITLYGKVQEHMVTSLSVDEITYLTSSILGYDFSMEDIISIQGNMAMGDKNEEFHVNDEMLRELIIETFYE